MSQNSIPRLKKIKIINLFGVFNHVINFNRSERVTLLHGPNGVGKTVLLRMTDALLQDNISYFRSFPFSSFSLQFDNTTSLTLESNGKAEPDDPVFNLVLHNSKTHTAKIDWTGQVEYIASQIDFLEPHEVLRKTWVDVRDGEILSADKVRSRFSRSSKKQEINWYVDFISDVSSHLIEAERLVSPDSGNHSQHDFPWRDQSTTIKSTVLQYSKDFKRRLGETMAQYGRQSQALDQSFPQRLVSAIEELPIDEIQKRLSAMDEKTMKLKSMGILDETPLNPFDDSGLESIDETQRRVMTVYVGDTGKKLLALDDLANRTELFLQIINNKYRHKQIYLDRDEGIIAKSKNNEPLPLSSLSSGEQHELVLNYDLLFKVPKNSVVLIDEPELSLHVAWQKRFLPDLLEIVNLADFDALVATHSPFIAGEHEELMVGLGEDF